MIRELQERHVRSYAERHVRSYTPTRRRPLAAGPEVRPGDEAIVEVAKSNPTDGTRMSPRWRPASSGRQ